MLLCEVLLCGSPLKKTEESGSVIEWARIGRAPWALLPLQTHIRPRGPQEQRLFGSYLLACVSPALSTAATVQELRPCRSCPLEFQARLQCLSCLALQPGRAFLFLLVSQWSFPHSFRPFYRGPSLHLPSCMWKGSHRSCQGHSSASFRGIAFVVGNDASLFSPWIFTICR